MKNHCFFSILGQETFFILSARIYLVNEFDGPNDRGRFNPAMIDVLAIYIVHEDGLIISSSSSAQTPGAFGAYTGPTFQTPSAKGRVSPKPLHLLAYLCLTLINHQHQKPHPPTFIIKLLLMLWFLLSRQTVVCHKKNCQQVGFDVVLEEVLTALKQEEPGALQDHGDSTDSESELPIVSFSRGI